MSPNKTQAACFATPATLPSSTAASPLLRGVAPAVCTTSPPAVRKVRMVRMAASGEAEEKTGIMDWLLSKILHNLDGQVGYEPFHKDAMNARDAEQQKMYEEQDEKKSQQ